MTPSRMPLLKGPGPWKRGENQSGRGACEPRCRLEVQILLVSAQEVRHTNTPLQSLGVFILAEAWQQFVLYMAVVVLK